MGRIALPSGPRVTKRGGRGHVASRPASPGTRGGERVVERCRGASNPAAFASGCAIRVTSVDDRHACAIGTRGEGPLDESPSESEGNLIYPRLVVHRHRRILPVARYSLRAYTRLWKQPIRH